MRREVCLGLLVLLAALAPGCDSDDPLRVTDQNADLEITANNAEVSSYKTWQLYEDSDLDGTPDDVNGDGEEGDLSLWCEDVGPGFPFSVPWTFSVRVAVIRNGTTVAEYLTSTQAQSDLTNRAPYDSLVRDNFSSNNVIALVHQRGWCSGNTLITCNPLARNAICDDYGNVGPCEYVYSCTGDYDTICDPTNPGTTCSLQGAGQCTAAGVCSGDPTIPCEPTCGELALGTCINDTVSRFFFFDNSTTGRRELTGANLELLSAGPNFVTYACDGDVRCEADVELTLGGTPLDPRLGNCPFGFVGEAEFDPFTADANPDPTIFGFELLKGDTVQVEARRSAEVPGGGQVIDFIQAPGLRARLFIDGTQLRPDQVTGNLSSSSQTESPNISFSYRSE
jgi:hypothetical protein